MRGSYAGELDPAPQGPPGATSPILRGSTRNPTTNGVVHMTIEKDPVCGMDVDTTATDLKLEHDGTTYWFCGKGCLLEFRDDPDRFLDPDYRPSM